MQMTFHSSASPEHFAEIPRGDRLELRSERAAYRPFNGKYAPKHIVHMNLDGRKLEYRSHHMSGRCSNLLREVA